MDIKKWFFSDRQVYEKLESIFDYQCRNVNLERAWEIFSKYTSWCLNPDGTLDEKELTMTEDDSFEEVFAWNLEQTYRELEASL